jgi:predicted nucleic acid-binding protein
MRFWDSSAVVPLILQEPATETMRALLAEDSDMIVWALTGLEVTSALWRRTRSGDLTDGVRAAAAAALGDLETSWNKTIDVSQVTGRARRVLAAHALRAADACQLATALLICRERTGDLPFVTLDERLGEAARREGFVVLGT